MMTNTKTKSYHFLAIFKLTNSLELTYCGLTCAHQNLFTQTSKNIAIIFAKKWNRKKPYPRSF